MSYFIDLIVAGVIATIAFGLVWIFFRFFVPDPGEGDEQKWRVPGAAAGFFAIFPTLATIYLSFTPLPSGNLLVQETAYGALEVDVDRLLLSQADAELRLSSDFYVDPDTSYYIQIPHEPIWRLESDSAPTFSSSVELQARGQEGFQLLTQMMSGIPEITDPRVQRFCISDRDVRQLTYDVDTRLNGWPLFEGTFSMEGFWDVYLDVLPEYLRTVLPDSLKIYADSIEITESDREQAIEFFSTMFPHATQDPPVDHEFRNSLCIASMDLEDLRSRVHRAVGIPRRPFTLMSLATTMGQVHPGFALSDVASVEVSSDSRVMLLRSPINLTNVLMDESFYDSLTSERLYLIALAPPRAFIAQVQFLLAPGHGLARWRDIQESFRTLRFLVN